jgi:type II secretory pathway component GspD/PulD (secretin)
MIEKLDVTSDRDQDVYVFKMKNADPTAAATVLQNMFQSSSSRSTTSQSQNSALTTRAQNNATTSGSSSSSSTGFGTMGSSGGRAGGTQF